MNYQTIPEIVDAQKQYRNDGTYDFLVTWPDGEKRLYNPDTFHKLFIPLQVEMDRTVEETDDCIQILQSTTFFIPKGYSIKQEDGKLSIKPPKED